MRPKKSEQDGKRKAQKRKNDSDMSSEILLHTNNSNAPCQDVYVPIGQSNATHCAADIASDSSVNTFNLCKKSASELQAPQADPLSNTSAVVSTERTKYNQRSLVYPKISSHLKIEGNLDTIGYNEKLQASKAPKNLSSVGQGATQVGNIYGLQRAIEYLNSEEYNEEDIGDDEDYDEADEACDNTLSSTKDQEAGKKTKKGLPFDPNGRFHGRKLVMWHRPRMMEKLLLHVQYECHRRGVLIPWDHIVHRLHPGSSGPSALQHLSKLRDVLITEGHLVPPLLGKVTVKQDPSIRGFIRDMTANIPTTARIVRWEENIEDLRESLVVPGVVRGSGNYRKGEPKAIENTTKNPDGSRRNRLPAELQAEIAERVAKSNRKRRPKVSTPLKASIKKEESSPVFAELDSDDDYYPSVKRQRSGRPSRIRGLKKSLFRGDDTDSEVGSDNSAIATRGASSRISESMTDPFRSTPAMKPKLSLMTPPRSSLTVKLNLPPSQLARFPGGESGTKFLQDQIIKPDLTYQRSCSETSSVYRDDELTGHGMGDSDPFKQCRQTSFRYTSRNKSSFGENHHSYGGQYLHGSLEQFVKASVSHEDSLMNSRDLSLEPHQPIYEESKTSNSTAEVNLVRTSRVRSPHTYDDGNEDSDAYTASTYPGQTGAVTYGHFDSQEVSKIQMSSYYDGMTDNCDFMDGGMVSPTDDDTPGFVSIGQDDASMNEVGDTGVWGDARADYCQDVLGVNDEPTDEHVEVITDPTKAQVLMEQTNERLVRLMAVPEVQLANSFSDVYGNTILDDAQTAMIAESPPHFLSSHEGFYTALSLDHETSHPPSRSDVLQLTSYSYEDATAATNGVLSREPFGFH